MSWSRPSSAERVVAGPNNWRPHSCAFGGSLTRADTTRLIRSTRGRCPIKRVDMALIELWKNNPDELHEKHVQQVIAFAGEGKLKDGGVASKEYRDLLAIVPSSYLERY